MTDLERKIIDISYKLKLSHIGSCLTAVGIIDDIYGGMRPNSKFVLSAGHAHLAHAVIMEKYGIIKSAEENILKHGIHCERAGGCDCSTGSLGQGLPIALGMAMADPSRIIYCLVSDGELAEGSCYEALNIKRSLRIENLKVYCNWNGWGAYGRPDGDANKTYVVDTRNHWFMQRYGQEAHYRVLTDMDYNEIVNRY